MFFSYNILVNLVDPYPWLLTIQDVWKSPLPILIQKGLTEGVKNNSLRENWIGSGTWF